MPTTEVSHNCCPGTQSNVIPCRHQQGPNGENSRADSGDESLLAQSDAKDHRPKATPMAGIGRWRAERAWRTLLSSPGNLPNY